MSTPSISGSYAQARPTGMPRGPKAEAQELTEKVADMFKILSQKAITKSSLSQIHEPRLGWKESLLNAYQSDNLMVCAELLEEVIDAYVESAKKLLQRDKTLAQDVILKTLASLGQNEKTLMVCNSLSKQVQTSTLGPLAKSALSLAPTVAIGTYRLVSTGVGSGVTSFGSAALKIWGAFSNIPVLIQSAEILPLIKDVMARNPWPALAGGVAALGTAAAMYGSVQNFPAALLGTDKPLETTMTVAVSAMELVRLGQWFLKKGLPSILPTRAAEQPFTQIIVGNKEILVETQKISLKEKSQALKRLNIIKKGAGQQAVKKSSVHIKKQRKK